MYRFIFLLLLLFFSGNIFGQEKEVETIKWKAEKLTWEDFKASPKPAHERQVASTQSGITYAWSYAPEGDKINLTYDVFANFYPKKSWVVPKEKTPELLAHEQLHFDISEWHARKLLKALKAYEPMRNIRTDLARIYRQIELERKREQAKYDRETRHGLNKIAQKEWAEFVAEELELVDAK